MNYEKGLAELQKLKNEFDSAELISSESSESDTRAKVITVILRDVLGWPEASISREVHSDSGFSDYILKCPGPKIVVEAKRIGKHFVFPIEKTRRTYSLSSLRSQSDDVGSAVRQVRAYADDHGIEFACATNGAQWIVFQAITRGHSWLEGKGIVYRSLEDVLENFTDFWNLLSYEAVSNGIIQATFSSESIDKLDFRRPNEQFLYSDSPLQRNKLSLQLSPLIERLFRDLTGAEQSSVLERCYVAERKVLGVTKHVEEIFIDTVPSFAKKAGFLDLVESETRSGALDDDFRRAVARGSYGTTILLLGGIGSGKTTFIHRFFRVNAKDFLDEHCMWFLIPFTEAPLNADEFRAFVRRRVAAELKSRYAKFEFETLGRLQAIYQDDIDAMRRGTWALLSVDEQNRREAEYIESRMKDDRFSDDVIRFVRRSGIAVSLILDNVDQREPFEQMRVFLLAHEICRDLDAIVIVALREESFFKAEQAGAFNAYHNIRYHIASPDVRKLLRKRIGYALDVAKGGEENLRMVLRSGAKFESEEIFDFLRIMNKGVLKANPAITQFVDAICAGNMRTALEMFSQFLVSGTTNVEKMLEIFRETGSYRVAEHEFVKAVMLGDFQFYKDRRSPIANLFEVSSETQSSNLTALRLLEYLDRQSGKIHAEGQGFVSLTKMLDRFSEALGDPDDFFFHLQRLLKKRLIESDSREISDLAGIVAVRATKAGRYYLRTLVGRFVYLDLVSLDTPMWSGPIADSIRSHPASTDLYARFSRVEWFLQYLSMEEERTLRTSSSVLVDELFGNNLSEKLRKTAHVDIGRVIGKVGLDRGAVEQDRGKIADYVKKLRPDE